MAMMKYMRVTRKQSFYFLKYLKCSRFVLSLFYSDDPGCYIYMIHIYFSFYLLIYVIFIVHFYF